jgi:hypothetical protein
MSNFIFTINLKMELLGIGLSFSAANIFLGIFVFASLFHYQELKEAMFWPSLDKTTWLYIK